MSVRSFDVEGGEKWPYQYAVIPIDECVIDHAYQRDSKVDWIKAKKEMFDPLLVMALVGSRRDNGQVALVDGQQRWLLMKELGYTHVPVLLMIGLTPAQEARIFADLNFEINRIRAFFHYRALLYAGDPHIVAVDDLVNSHGFAVGSKLNPEPSLSAAGTIVKIYDKHSDVVNSQSDLDGPEILARILDVLNLAWRNRTTAWNEAKTSGMLHGLGRWISSNEAISSDVLAAALENASPAVILSEGASAGSGSGSGKGRGVETIIERLFRKANPKAQRRREAA